MNNYIEEMKKKGYKKICYIDEVGRGCLAGDVVACALILKEKSHIEGVRDSKKLTDKKRRSLYDEILKDVLAVGIGRVKAEDIDRINIKEATRLAMKFAVENLINIDGEIIKPDLLIIDNEIVDLKIEQRAFQKADDLFYGVSCASILAKVYRDDLCIEWDKKYPGYHMDKHKGYGTKLHREKILELGPSKIHRLSFLSKILNSSKVGENG